MTKDEYAKYLQSEHWQSMRRDILAEIDTCTRCDMPRWLSEIAYGQDLHLHHLNYANLGAEDVQDLEVLCPRCHELETFGISKLRAPWTGKCALCFNVYWNPRCEFCPACYLIIQTPYLMWLAQADSPYRGGSMYDHILSDISFSRTYEDQTDEKQAQL